VIAQMELQLIKMATSHYFTKSSKGRQISFRGRTLFDRFERVDQTLSSAVMNEHFSNKAVIAHDLILEGDFVENIVFDFNGIDTVRFYHRAQLMLREEGFLNFTAFESATIGHLHVYIHKGHTPLLEGYNIAKTLSTKLSQKLPLQWRVFPSPDLPREFNILALPHKVYAKERGTNWSKYM
jgi:hypothetical protein